MKKPKKSTRKLKIISIAAIVLALGGGALALWGDKSDNAESKHASQPAERIRWEYDGQAWRPMGGTPPQCEQPLRMDRPTDISRMTSVLYPGQVRGGDYKPHGGLARDNATDNLVGVSTVRDAYIVSGARYIEMGEVQYMFDFVDACGIMVRYDHLLTLTPKFQEYANRLPEPKVDDSRTTPIDDPKMIKSGTLIASEVGTKNKRNVGFDLGVYDLRQPNEASKTAKFQTDPKIISDKSQSYYAICWFDLLPADNALIRSLPSRGGQRENTSDYCKI